MNNLEMYVNKAEIKVCKSFYLTELSLLSVLWYR